MILQALTRYYEDLTKQGKIARPGWAKTKISYALCINGQGELEQVIPLLEDTGGKKPQPRKFDLPAPASRHGKVLLPNFLWDNSAYLLGIDKKKTLDETKKYFKESGKFHLNVLEIVDSPTAEAIRSFFKKWDPMTAEQQPVLKNEFSKIIQGVNLLIRVNGSFAHEDPQIIQAWQRYYNSGVEDGRIQQCLVSGKQEVIAKTHPDIRGIGEKSSATLVGFNAPAFCSYGQEQSYNAPVGKYAAFAYTSALNYLLADRENVQKIGDTAVVCWAEGAQPQYRAFTFAALFGQQEKTLSEDDVRSAVKRLAAGLPVPELDLKPEQPFYVLGLAPNAARLSVRFFCSGSFGSLMKNVNAHHERMEIVRPDYDNYETIPLWALLKETVNPNSRDKAASPVMAGAVARAIFTGGPYPAALLEQTMLRIRAERKISRGRAAIIKAHYLRNPNENCPKEVLTVALNEASTNPAYTLGRLFSVYEAVQEAANPGINTTIKDKYFNAASSTPATIFPILGNLCQKHLRKLGTGKRIWYEKQIMELKGILGEAYPARMDLPQQGAFDLGYYHQTQKRYEKKEEK